MATKAEQIRDTAMKCFAERGIAATPLRTIAAAAGVSLGSVQHYYATKQELIESIESHVLAIFTDALELEPPPAQSSPDSTTTAAACHFTDLMCENPDIMDYVGRALTEGGDIGTKIFDGLHAISEQQGIAFAKQGLTADDLDPVWAVMLPLILRVGTIMLRPHVERHLNRPLYDRAETSRWDAAASRMITEGQFQRQ